MSNDSATATQTILANAAELGAGIILNVVGNDISDSINNTPVGVTMLNNILQARFQKSLNLS